MLAELAMTGKSRGAAYLFAVFTVALASGCLDRELKPLNPCLVSGVTRKVAVTNVDYVDLLFVVDNSGSMRQEQGSLRDQFPKLITNSAQSVCRDRSCVGRTAP